MKYFSMFTGIGGFEYGIEKAFNNKHEPKIRGSKEGWNRDIDKRQGSICSTNNTTLCVGYSEIDKYSIQTYKKHYPKHKNYGSATDIKWEEVPDFDILVGGFPCQAFSIAGKRRGFEDTRGTLFFEIARCLKHKRPSLCILENVKGLLSHDEGKTFSTILSSLSKLGYDVEWQVLNSKHFGVPQNRERVFIIGHLRGTSKQKIFPIREDESHFNKKSRGKSLIPTTIGRTVTTRFGDRYQDTFIKTIKSGYYKQGKDNPFIIDRGTIRRGEWGNGVHKDESGTLNSSSGNDFILNSIRRLTPIECERLQGFPDNWTEGVSDTQRYKQLGNAVTTNVIVAIFKKI